MPRDNELAQLAALAARLCDCRIAIVTLADGRDHYLKHIHGISLPDPMPLLAFCHSTVSSQARLVVPDARADARFAEAAIVTGEPHVRFYMGVPLKLPDGPVAGTVAVLDSRARTPDTAPIADLETLAAQVMAQLELRRHRHVLAGLSAERERMNLMLARQTGHFIQIAGRSAQLGGWEMQLPSRRVLFSAEAAAIYGDSAGGPQPFRPFVERCVPAYRDKVTQAFDDCARLGAPFDIQLEVVTTQGTWRWVRMFGQAVRDAHAEVTSVQGATQDITASRRAEDDARRLATRLTDTLESITDAFFTLDRDWHYTYLNREAQRLFAHEGSELLGQPVWEEFRSAVEAQLAKAPARTASAEEPIEFEQFYEPARLWLKVRAYPSDDGLAVYVRDVTERHESQRQLELLELSISRLNDLVLISQTGDGGATDQRIVFVNEAFAREAGFAREELIGQSPSIMHGANTQPAELARIAAALRANEPVRAELVYYRKSGDEFWIELDMAPVADAHGHIRHWVSVGRDITQRKASEDAIQKLAFYDPLTRLPNRLLLMERLKAALEAPPEEDSGALMFIDLDNFKTLNDTKGHDKGDLLLQQVADRLTHSVRKSDTVARLGGDEFVVMLGGLGTEPGAAYARARLTAEKILAALGRPYLMEGSEHHSTSSIGIAPFRGGQGSVGDLLKHADLAMYQAKLSGRNTFRFFDPQMQAAASELATLNAELRHGLRERQFTVHYQPQVDREGRMSGVEALLRWQHPQRGLVQPVDFIHAAEDTGLILPLGHWVLDTACEQLAAWARRPETSQLTIAVNVSVRQFRNPEFVDLVMASIRRTGIEASRLELELTETLLADDMEVTIGKMATLKDMGVKLAIDDFGMGYSSLSSLKRLPLDQVKIDKEFVRDILRDPNDAAIARAIVAMAQSLGLGILAEGVENEGQLDFLVRQGCYCYQGSLFCGPLPIGELEQFMAALPPEIAPASKPPTRRAAAA